MQSPTVLAATHRLGAHVQAMRKRQRLTQEQLAERAGVGRTTLHKLEAGHPGVAIASVLEVLQVLDPEMVDRILEVIDTDPLGRALERRRLPQRVARDDDF
ncbi:helix-turn-helix domain-containing protein [Stenotrophomonas sp. 278]|uniref:helix-turn-helix domain-containing protein n=1 Tax=Stenotrophomonas sp. 278 TaxID=2479851 RepID=UPI000F660AD9|nr:helix-turn-helix domain-containing protein [Stenotrophomonas sp. 278]RRU07470.1 transcriptional regulator [Stenotrophomonas sp. 278]